MKKLSLIGVTLLAALTITACSSNKVSESTPSSTSSVEQSSSSETSSTTETVKYDVGEMNVKVTDSFNESVEFNQQGEDGYEWTAYIYEIKLKENGAIDATVNEAFGTLSDSEKTEVLNSVSRSVNAVVFIETGEDKSYLITAHDQSGNKVAQSKMTNPLKYNFE